MVVNRSISPLFDLTTPPLPLSIQIGLFHNFNSKLEHTTLTLEHAIAAPAIIGCKCHPHGKNNPIANGIPKTLYKHAHMKFIFILRNITLDKSIAATTSIISDLIKTISA